jgi:hypothetical protein
MANTAGNRAAGDVGRRKECSILQKAPLNPAISAPVSVAFATLHYGIKAAFVLIVGQGIKMNVCFRAQKVAWLIAWRRWKTVKEIEFFFVLGESTLNFLPVCFSAYFTKELIFFCVK